MKSISVYLLLIFLLNLDAFGATIKGKVLSQNGHKPVVDPPCNINILGTNLGACPDANGFYIITNVPLGRHLLRFSDLTYVTQNDTVLVTDSSETIVHNVEMQIPVIESTPNLEEYHQKLQQENLNNPVLSIEIDDYDFKDGHLTFRLLLHNNSELPIYVLKDNDCTYPFSPIILNHNGDTIRENMLYYDPVGKLMPDSSDMITLPPGKTISYPPMPLALCDFNNYPSGKYIIQLKYEYEVPSQLCCYEYDVNYKTTFYSVIKTYASVLRGIYFSNKIKFRNY